ncbi:MAG: sugar ABC transporter permease [Clostridia bacterium]|nr:sugar ABC transporter permease [Clostridia bacterium]
MKGRKKHSAWSRHRRLTGFIFLIPMLVFTSVFILYPLFRVIYYSFFSWNGIGRARFVGLDNYMMLPDTEGFWQMVKATIVYAAGVTVLTVAAGYVVALALDTVGKGRINRTFMRVLWFFPCLLSGIIVGIIWHIMYNYNSGLVNYIVTALGFGRVNWLETYGLTMGAVIVASVWGQIGMCAVIFLAGLQSISHDLLEAAEIDGASSFQKQKDIIFPIMAPSITINIITTTIAAFKAYELPYTVSNGLPGYSTRILTQRVYFYSFETNKYGIASALSVILVVAISIVSLLQLVVLKKREDIY